MQTDVCNYLDRFSVGQNVAATWTFDKPSPFGEDPEFKRQIDAWFDEVNKFHSQDIKPFSFNHHAGHYTQVTGFFTYAHVYNIDIYISMHTRLNGIPAKHLKTKIKLN